MAFRRRIAPIACLLLGLVLIGRSAQGFAGHSHAPTESCPQCAALPGGRRKFVAVPTIRSEILARPIADAKLTVIASAADGAPGAITESGDDDEALAQAGFGDVAADAAPRGSPPS